MASFPKVAPWYALPLSLGGSSPVSRLWPDSPRSIQQACEDRGKVLFGTVRDSGSICLEMPPLWGEPKSPCVEGRSDRFEPHNTPPTLTVAAAVHGTNGRKAATALLMYPPAPAVSSGGPAARSSRNYVT